MAGTSIPIEKVMTDAAEAMQHDRWMVAIWSKPSDAEIDLVLSMEKFPHVDFYEAVRLLRDQCEALMEQSHVDEESQVGTE